MFSGHRPIGRLWASGRGTAQRFLSQKKTISPFPAKSANSKSIKFAWKGFWDGWYFINNYWFLMKKSRIDPI
jgi:hypothetical protein